MFRFNTALENKKLIILIDYNEHHIFRHTVPVVSFKNPGYNKKFKRNIFTANQHAFISSQLHVPTIYGNHRDGTKEVKVNSSFQG